MVHGRQPLARLGVLGRFRLNAADGRDLAPRGAKARALLAFLALSPEGRCDRGRLAGLLWGEGADAKASLRQGVAEVRRALLAGGGEAAAGLLRADPRELALDLDACRVDALELRRALLAPGPDDPGAVAELLGGELLADVDARDPAFEQWLQGERARLRETVGRALDSASRGPAERGPAEPDGVERLAAALLALEPSHEGAHRALMRCAARRGDTAGAVRRHRACREALARDLGVRPSRDTESLLAEILNAAAAAAAEPRPGEPAGDDGPSKAVGFARVGRPVLAAVLGDRRAPPATVAVEARAPEGADEADRAVVGLLADGLRQGLARMRWVAVVDAATQGLFATTDRSGPLERGYRATVDLRRFGERVRVSAQLVSTAGPRIVWADRFDRAAGGDVFDLADELAAAIGRRLRQEVEQAEIARASRRPPEALGAQDRVLRAIPLVFRLTRESFAEAGPLLKAAEDADPNDAMVFAWRAFWYFLSLGQGWVADVRAGREELGWIVRRAIELDPQNALALAVAGHVASFVERDYERALGLFRRSLSLDPSSPYAVDLSALTLCYSGNAEEALAQLDGSRELWDRQPHPYFFRTTEAIAASLAGRHERAVDAARQAIGENPSFHAPYRPLIASLGHLGRIEEARAHLARLSELEPGFSVGWFREHYPRLHRDYTERYVEGLRRAGVPEA